jgi:N-methylhydantoinase A
MASAIREISVQKGWDPRQFPLICAGGAGAVHAAMIARELGIRRIVVPREAAIFCASGMLRTDLKHDFVRSYAAVLGEASVDQAHLAGLLQAMDEEAHGVLASEGIASAQRRMVYSVDLRYLGQYHEVPVDTTAEQLQGGQWEAVREAFHERHDRLFGYALREDDAVVELVSVRLSAQGITDKPPPVHEALLPPDTTHLQKGRREVFQPETGAFASTPVYDGDRLQHGHRLEGPAIIEKVTTSIFVPAGFSLAVDAFGGCILEDHLAEPAEEHA